MADRHAIVTAVDLGGPLAELVGPAYVAHAARELVAAGVPPGDAATARAWVVRPGSAAEIAGIVRLAGGHGARVVPLGTASRRPLAPRPGGRASRPRIIVDVRRLAHVLFLDELSLVVQVQAGITGLALEELLLPRGLTLGDFPPAALRSSIGGMLSVRTPGKLSPRHGFFEDAVLGLSVVLADGRTIHTRIAPRRATGPDLARAFLGSEGTLGVVTGAVLRIHRRPEARVLDTFRLPTVAAALDAYIEALRADARPAALRIFDAAEACAHLGGGTARGDEAILALATAGPPELASLDRDLVAAAARARGATPLGPGLAEIWWRRRFGHPVPGAIPPPPALEVWAPAPRLTAVHAAAVAAARAAGREGRAHLSRVDLDGGCVFVTLLDGELPDPHGPARARVEEAARAAGGHLVGDREEALDAYRDALREELDPLGVFFDAS